jgi:hypothetical protein
VSHLTIFNCACRAVNWHGMVQVPSGYGMIETIGGIDFNCTGAIGPIAMVTLRCSLPLCFKARVFRLIKPVPSVVLLQVCEDGTQGASPPHTEADTGEQAADVLFTRTGTLLVIMVHRPQHALGLYL